LRIKRLQECLAISRKLRLEEYAARVTREEFDRDPLIQDGFVRRITVLGEAAGKISKGFATSHPDIPWPDITGIRHKLVHDYSG